MESWKKAGVIENQFEGDRIRQALREAEIPFIIKSFLDTAYNGLYVPQRGWAAVLVPEAWLARAEEVILEVKRSFQEEER